MWGMMHNNIVLYKMFTHNIAKGEEKRKQEVEIDR